MRCVQGTQILWESVLRKMSADETPLAHWAVAAFLVSPSQSSAGERTFSEVTHLKKLLGPHVTHTVMSQYLLVTSHGAPEEVMRHSSLAKLCLQDLLANDRRVAQGKTSFYNRNGKLVRRKRKLRADVGVKRPKYTVRKRWSAL
jgi:hypothetical protein